MLPSSRLHLKRPWTTRRVALAPGARMPDGGWQWPGLLVPLFEVEDAQQAAGELRAAGADVIGNPGSDGNWTWIHVRAPDGNLYEFASRRRGEPD
jgi:hypothetical protein